MSFTVEQQFVLSELVAYAYENGLFLQGKASSPQHEQAGKALKGWPQLHEQFKLLKTTTHEERSWPVDKHHENGNYSCICVDCRRLFDGHKRRQVCRDCACSPQVNIL